MQTTDGFEALRDANAELLRRFDEYRDAQDEHVRQNIADEAREAIEIHLRAVEAVVFPAIDAISAGSDPAGARVRGEAEHEVLRLLMDRLGPLYIAEAGFDDLVEAIEEHLRAYVAFIEDRALTVLESRLTAAKFGTAWHAAVTTATRDSRAGP